MTDREVFRKFMGWMGMQIEDLKEIDNNTVVVYKDNGNESENFSKVGYDEFYSGAMFNEEGGMVKGYIDSHVAHTSCNYDFINKLIK
jgi:hypothetical protein